jgi:hypothetical protein
MKGLFAMALLFNQNLSMWNVSNVSDFTLIFYGVTLSNSNYDALLIGWSNLDLVDGLVLDAGNSISCSNSAQQAKYNIINNQNWTIIDGGTCVLSNEFFDDASNAFKIFPNPTFGKLEIESVYAIESIQLYDVNGKKLSNKEVLISDNKYILSLENLNNGIYLLSVKTINGFETFKVVKN